MEDGIVGSSPSRSRESFCSCWPITAVPLSLATADKFDKNTTLSMTTFATEGHLQLSYHLFSLDEIINNYHIISPQRHKKHAIDLIFIRSAAPSPGSNASIGQSVRSAATAPGGGAGNKAAGNGRDYPGSQPSGRGNGRTGRAIIHCTLKSEGH